MEEEVRPGGETESVSWSAGLVAEAAAGEEGEAMGKEPERGKWSLLSLQKGMQSCRYLAFSQAGAPSADFWPLEDSAFARE